MKTLTIDQAKAEGYRMCGYDGLETYESLNSMEEILKDGNEYFLAEKQAEEPYLGKASDITEFLADRACEELSEGGCETFPEFLSQFEPEFQAILDKIKAKAIEYNATNTYYLTNIRLVPNPSAPQPNK